LALWQGLDVLRPQRLCVYSLCVFVCGWTPTTVLLTMHSVKHQRSPTHLNTGRVVSHTCERAKYTQFMRNHINMHTQRSVLVSAVLVYTKQPRSSLFLLKLGATTSSIVQVMYKKFNNWKEVCLFVFFERGLHPLLSYREWVVTSLNIVALRSPLSIYLLYT